MAEGYDEVDAYAQGGSSHHDDFSGYMDDQYDQQYAENPAAAGADDGAGAQHAEANEAEAMTGVVKNAQGNILDPNKSDTG
ncbi:hypothetical protein HK097_008059 [Rhizophlyctis rosea]|uniref:Uncharacterized protein n=1 Tax=Rhizophlyctis rosea TaxID=64517 RepID=A0AAD5SDY6_9FUNG|nr:hypothetical protein HK097_008059 [Rhizophlyctis rosea]